MLAGMISGCVLYYKKRRLREPIPQEENESVTLEKFDGSPKKRSSFSSPEKCSLPNMTCGVVNPNLIPSIDSPSGKCNGFLDYSNSSAPSSRGNSLDSPYSQESTVSISLRAQSPPPPMYQSHNSLIRSHDASVTYERNGISPATIRKSPASMLKMVGRVPANHLNHVFTQANQATV